MLEAVDLSPECAAARRLRAWLLVGVLPFCGCGRTGPRGWSEEFVRIPAGTFLMGCVPTDEVCGADERPRHAALLPAPVWLQRTETTVAQWRRFAAATGYRSEAERAARGRMFVVARDSWEWIGGLSWAAPIMPWEFAPDAWPAVQVSPGDAEAFCRWVGGRLPTEVEWERAARGGRDDQIHVWGEETTPWKSGRALVNGPDSQTLTRFPHWKVFPEYDDGYATLAPVGSFPPNAYGLVDIAGNAYEWTADAYDSTAYLRRSTLVPLPSAADSSLRVVRGGGWGYEPDHFRISFRGYFEARGFWTATVGFRCARDSAP